MILVIDNYDSFAYNLVQYLGELEQEPAVFRNDAIALEDIVDISKIRQVLDTAKLNHTLIYETIAITGVNVKRAFVYAARQSVLNHYKKLSGKAMEESSF